MPEADDTMNRLNRARTVLDKMSQDQSRLTGEKNTHEKILAELEKRCKDEFQCGIDQMPELIAGFDEQAVKSLDTLEIVLGIRQEEVAEEAAGTDEDSVV